MESSNEEAARIDAELKEIERSMAELLSKKQELVRAKAALRAKAPGATTTPPSAGASPDPATAAMAVAPAPSASVYPASTKALESALNELEWNSFKKKEGEWSFFRSRDGRLLETLEGETEFVNQLRKGKEIVIGRYRYKVSEDKFLNRFFEA